jgi:hypothetical protein
MAVFFHLLGEMLGVQRLIIINAAQGLEGAGLIARGRRSLRIRDWQGLVEGLVDVLNWSGRASLCIFPERVCKNSPASVMYITDRLPERGQTRGNRPWEDGKNDRPVEPHSCRRR